MRTMGLPLTAILVILGAPSPAPAQATLPASSADWTVLGDQATGTFGGHVASAGDVDGDGYDDVMIGDASHDGALADSGRITFYRGSAAGPSLAPSWTLEGSSAGARLAEAFPAGDVNGDGFDDVVVRSAPTLSLYLGSPAGPVPASWTVSGTSTRSGDIDADGFDDLAVFANPDLLVFHGSAAGPPSVPTTTLTVPVEELAFPLVDGAFGDLNGDGYDDFSLTWRNCPNLCSVTTAELRVYIGSPDGLVTQPKRKLPFKDKYSDQWAYVASAGDADGDGYGDLALTLYTGSGPDAVYRLRGSPSGLNTKLTFIASSFTATLFSESVDGIGEFDGDGLADLLVPFMDPVFRSMRIYAGSPGGYAPAPAVVVETGQYSGELDVVAAPAGDVNGDGLGDLVIGEPRFLSGGTLMGRVYVFLGSPTF